MKVKTNIQSPRCDITRVPERTIDTLNIWVTKSNDYGSDRYTKYFLLWYIERTIWGYLLLDNKSIIIRHFLTRWNLYTCTPTYLLIITEMYGIRIQNKSVGIEVSSSKYIIVSQWYRRLFISLHVSILWKDSASIRFMHLLSRSCDREIVIFTKCIYQSVVDHLSDIRWRISYPLYHK